MIGFAYRAAEARPQMSQARRISRESIGFFLPRSHLLAQIVVFGRWVNQ
jgi:hypothetical protein